MNSPTKTLSATDTDNRTSLALRLRCQGRSAPLSDPSILLCEPPSEVDQTIVVGGRPSQNGAINISNHEVLASTGRMIYGIAHDIRHYLAAIYANSELLVGRGLPAQDLYEACKDMQDAVDDICAMLDHTLICSRKGEDGVPL